MKIVRSITWPHVKKMLTKMWPGYWLIGGQLIDPLILSQKKLTSTLQNPQKYFLVFWDQKGKNKLD